MQEQQKPNSGTKSLIWFRNDLRVQDNPSLKAAMESGKAVIGVYCFQPRLFETGPYGFRKTEKFRAKFLLETVNELESQLKRLNIPLLVFHTAPRDAIPSLILSYNIDTVYFQNEWTSEEQQIEDRLRDLCPPQVQWIGSYSQFLFHPEDLPFGIEKVPEVFTAFRKKCEKYVKVRGIEPVKALPRENYFDTLTEIPSLEELGFDSFHTDPRSAFPYSGGEQSAIKRMDEYIWEKERIKYYKQTRNGLVGTDYSSKFSSWLANGSISARTIYHEVRRYEEEFGGNQSTYWMIFELIWRDYFKYISLKHGNSIFQLKGIKGRDYDWNNSKEAVDAWIEGRTSEPFVNANMIELQLTGWMSNRGRQNVASYFAKDLQLDWRIGAAYFESMLIDYDVHSNYGNWMYVAGVGNDPRDRKFNVALQAKRYDSHNKFQNRWLQTTLF